MSSTFPCVDAFDFFNSSAMNKMSEYWWEGSEIMRCWCIRMWCSHKNLQRHPCTGRLLHDVLRYWHFIKPVSRDLTKHQFHDVQVHRCIKRERNTILPWMLSTSFASSNVLIGFCMAQAYNSWSSCLFLLVFVGSLLCPVDFYKFMLTRVRCVTNFQLMAHFFETWSSREIFLWVFESTKKNTYQTRQMAHCVLEWLFVHWLPVTLPCASVSSLWSSSCTESSLLSDLQKNDCKIKCQSYMRVLITINKI